MIVSETESKSRLEPNKQHDQSSSELSGFDSEVRLAVYIALAHAALAFFLVLLYGLYRLLQDFVRPIQWAILCSIPLREIQNAIVSFWSEPLTFGLTDTFLAVPAAVFRGSSSTLIDIRQACISVILRKKCSKKTISHGVSGRTGGFEKLVQWLISFGMFLFSYERFGFGAVAMFGLVFLFSDPKAVAVVRNASFVRRSKSRFSILTRGILRRLETVVAVGLIFALITGVLVGGVFFSYSIGVESKDAVMSMKTRVQESNYAERIGFKTWMDDNDIPGMIDQYSGKLYDTVLDQIDAIAEQYNVTEFTNGFKQFFLINKTLVDAPATILLANNKPHPYAQKLQSLSTLAKNHDWMGIYTEMDSILQEVLMSRLDLVDMAKSYAFQSMEVSKQVLASSSSLVGGGASLLFSIGLSVLSGAVEVLHFVSQSMVFFWLLYYLITSNSGGATEQAMAMVPIPSTMKERCVEVINHAISSVFLATAKIAFFQGCLTWLLFRFYNIHFLYGSTILALLSPLLPILPTWLSSIPAATQLLMEGR